MAPATISVQCTSVFKSPQWQKLKRFEQQRLQNMTQRHKDRRQKIQELVVETGDRIKERTQQDLKQALTAHVDDLNELLKVLEDDDIDADMLI